MVLRGKPAWESRKSPGTFKKLFFLEEFFIYAGLIKLKRNFGNIKCYLKK
tara:strand:+ start:163 stop:312 length:150 start_codon:yes stop_codon:yes gene_type:complete